MIIEHVAIWTRKLERLRAFYETYFHASSGEKYVNRQNQFESYFLEFDSGARLELMSAPNIVDAEDIYAKQSVGIAHLAFSAGSEHEVDVLTNRLKKEGYEIADGARRTGDGYYESVILDPDGNRIEITE